ncbi:MAG: lasso peptide biosynthesis B2 protein [Legionella sp.]|jgi:hypothetical protein
MKLTTFLLMPIQDKATFFINFFLCGIARALINLFGYKKLYPYFGYQCRMLNASTLISKQQMEQSIRIRRSIRLAARYTPWNSNCLTKAMVAALWCNYYKIPYLFFIGIAKKSEKPLGQDAHAWVTSGSIAITGEHSFNSYQVISTYSNSTVFKDITCTK